METEQKIKRYYFEKGNKFAANRKGMKSSEEHKKKIALANNGKYNNTKAQLEEFLKL